MIRSLTCLMGAALLLAPFATTSFVSARETKPAVPRAHANVANYVITLKRQGQHVGTLTIPRDPSVKMVTEADSIFVSPKARTTTTALRRNATLRILRGNQETLKLTGDEITVQINEPKPPSR